MLLNFEPYNVSQRNDIVEHHNAGMRVVDNRCGISQMNIIWHSPSIDLYEPKIRYRTYSLSSS